jgi:cytidine deaminase
MQAKSLPPSPAACSLPVQAQEFTSLVEEATKAMAHAYAPYSAFPVGAAILTTRGRIFSGCNVENASYGATTCAERIALYNAISSGERSFAAMALVARAVQPPVPCGLCLQVITEFAPELSIVMVNLEGMVRICSLKEFLPKPFLFNKHNCGS